MGRLVKVAQFRKILAASRWEFALALISALGVIFIGVEQGLGIAVGLRDPRPDLALGTSEDGRTGPAHGDDELGAGRRGRVSSASTTSWRCSSARSCFFANAGIFRREMHDHLAKLPETQHVIVDAVAIADIDYTGMTALSQVVADLDKDKISIAFSRANDTVKDRLKKSTSGAIKTIALLTAPTPRRSRPRRRRRVFAAVGIDRRDE